MTGVSQIEANDDWYRTEALVVQGDGQLPRNAMILPPPCLPNMGLDHQTTDVPLRACLARTEEWPLAPAQLQFHKCERDAHTG